MTNWPRLNNAMKFETTQIHFFRDVLVTSKGPYWPLQKIPQHTIVLFVCHPKILLACVAGGIWRRGLCNIVEWVGTRLRRQNFNLAPTQYRQLRRLKFCISIVFSFSRKSLNNNDRDQILWARETEHPTQTLVFTKTAGRQPGWGHCYLRSSVSLRAI